MKIIEYGDTKIELDDEGYLAHFEDWNEKMACGLAEQEGIDELSKERIEVIKFMRDYYNQFKAFPVLNSVCRNVHQSKGCVNEDFVDPLKAWKIAGLPKPSEEVISYLKR
jgi:tRNA 2-thiouridine synthesizing protein E